MSDTLKIVYSDPDFSIAELTSVLWDQAETVEITRYWSGAAAPSGRHVTAKLLWTDSALCVRFDAVVNEPLVVSDHPDLAKKTIGLWDRDVCEIFIAPDAARPNKYFEFEVAPNGEWVDLAIEVQAEQRLTDLTYSSGMASAARIDNGKTVSAIRVPWTALGRTPMAGDSWAGNLFRCVGSGPDRGYLAWQPTLTAAPSFHVPEKFGTFIFTS